MADDLIINKLCIPSDQNLMSLVSYSIIRNNGNYTTSKKIKHYLEKNKR